MLKNTKLFNKLVVVWSIATILCILTACGKAGVTCRTLPGTVNGLQGVVTLCSDGQNTFYPNPGLKGDQGSIPKNE